MSLSLNKVCACALICALADKGIGISEAAKGNKNIITYLDSHSRFELEDRFELIRITSIIWLASAGFLSSIRSRH